MTETQVKGAIMLVTGMMAHEFADSIGVARSTVYRCINGQQRTPAAMEAIAKAISQVNSVEVSWPPKPADDTAEAA